MGEFGIKVSYLVSIVLSYGIVHNSWAGHTKWRVISLIICPSIRHDTLLMGCLSNLNS